MLIRFSLILTLLISSASYGQLVKFMPLREYHQTGRKVFDDVMSHDSDDKSYGSIRATAHEHTHTASNKFYWTAGKDNNYEYLYVLDNYGYKIHNVKVRLSQLARRIPSQDRDEDYNTYLIQAGQWFENAPLSVINEWNAYTVGTMAEIEACSPEFDIQDQGWRMLELGIYSCYLAQMSQQNDLNEFIKLESKRNLFICSQTKMSDHMSSNLIKFKKILSETIK